MAFSEEQLAMMERRLEHGRRKKHLTSEGDQELKREADKNNRQASGAQPQSPVQDDAVRASQGEEADPGRISVCVRSFRSRLIDPDNLCPKWFIDCLRYAGFIRDDTSKDIRLTVEQFLVDPGSERTEITIDYP